MKGNIGAFALLSGIVSGAAAVDARDVQYANQDPGTWCVTYLSTYLVPVSISTDLPRLAENTTDVGLISTSTAQGPDLTSSVASSASASTTLEPTGQRIILLVSPSGGNTKRDIGGFVGDDNPDICTFATVFTLGNGQLSEDGVSVSYLGDGYQKLQASSSTSDDTVSTTFSSGGGVLRFQNPALPNGGASFCQTPSDGQVYMTFGSEPSGCVPVSLNVYRAEQCIDGRIDGLGPTTTSTKTDEIISTYSAETHSTATHSTKALSTEESSAETMTTISTAGTSAETSVIEPSIASTFSTEGSGVSMGSSSSKSPASEETEAPSGTLTDEPTATQSEGGVVITNAVSNGRFSIKDPNSASGIFGFDAEGEAEQRNGDCYKGDGSSDDGCVALGSSSDTQKRAFGGLASISQFLTNLAPSRNVLYTVQFYYVVITAGGNQACSVNGYLGNTQFYTMGLFTSGGVSVSWNRVLTTVMADSRSASFGISLSCTGNGLALIYVDSVFVSNQVTPDNIDQFQLDFGDSDTPEETTSRLPSTPTSEPANQVTSIEPVTTTTNPSPATTTGYTRPEIPSQEVCPDGYRPPGFCGQKWPKPSEPFCEYRSQPNAEAVAYPLSEYPMQGMDIQKCALTCAYIDGCFAFAVNNNPSYPCNFILEPLRLQGWTTGDPDRVLEWSELACFNCQLCDKSPSQTTARVTGAPVESETTVIAEPSTRIPQNTTRWLPEPQTSSGNLEPTPGTKSTSIRPPRPETSVDVEPTFIEGTTTWPETTHTSAQTPVVDTSSEAPEVSTPLSRDSTSLSEDETSTTQEPTSTSETTTASSTPTETCKYTHGEMCNFDRFNYPKDVLCSWGDKLTSRSFWLETRESYPHQDRAEECIAICQGHPLCLTAGYSQFENRCYFSELPLLKENFVAEDNDWKKQVWLDTRCYTDCEACVPDSVPKGPPDMCAYTLGDECKPVANPPAGTICNYEAYMGGGWVDGNDPNLLTVYTEYAQASPRRCAAICRAYPGCKGSGYKDDRCKFSVYKLALSGMPIPLETDQDSSMNSIWDDPACWTCPGCQ